MHRHITHTHIYTHTLYSHTQKHKQTYMPKHTHIQYICMQLCVHTPSRTAHTCTHRLTYTVPGGSLQLLHVLSSHLGEISNKPFPHVLVLREWQKNRHLKRSYQNVYFFKLFFTNKQIFCWDKGLIIWYFIWIKCRSWNELHSININLLVLYTGGTFECGENRSEMIVLQKQINDKLKYRIFSETFQISTVWEKILQ